MKKRPWKFVDLVHNKPCSTLFWHHDWLAIWGVSGGGTTWTMVCVQALIFLYSYDQTRVWEKKKGTSPSASFRSQQFFLSKICEKCFNQIYRDFVWRCNIGAHLDGFQQGDRKPTDKPLYSTSPNPKMHRGRYEKNIKIEIYVLGTKIWQDSGHLVSNISSAWLIAAAASEPEANERGSSLISRRLHYRG